MNLFSKARSLSLFLIACLSLMIQIGCSTDFLNSNNNPSTTTAEDYTSTANNHIRLSSEAQYPNSLAHRLIAAENYIKAGKNEEAAKTLRDILSQEPNMSPEFRVNIFEARHALLKQDQSRAITHIQVISKGISRWVDFQKMSTIVQKPTQRKIALLLPAKGPYAKAAKTIRDGFLTAYYKTASKASEPEVHIFDTTEPGGLAAAYNKAISSQVDLIVGPLTKAEVKALAKIKLSMPVLALNTVNETQDKLYQFGLMPEDEAETVALHAHRQGKKCALIVAPRGEWGDRMVTAFKSAFHSYEGKVAKIIRIDPSQIEQFPAQLQSLLPSQSLQSKKKNNEKLDMIFLAASPELGRQIKPWLSSQSGDLTVYATSAIYTGSPSPEQDGTLDGVKFCDMPWILNNTAELREAKQAIEKNPNHNVANASRYFALGMDAHQLAAQLTEAGLPIAGTQGLTGNLKLDEHRRIQRSLVCAKFEHGIPIPD